MDSKHEKSEFRDDNSSQWAASQVRAGVVHNEGAPRSDKVNVLEAQVAIDPAMDKILTRKFDLHIIPWLFGIW